MRITGQDCTVTIDALGEATTWKEYSIETEIDEEDASAAIAEYEQKTSGRKKASIKVSGWVDSDEAVAEALKVGMNVEFTPTGNVIDLSAYGQQRITKLSIKQPDKPGEWELEIGCGYVDAERI